MGLLGYTGTESLKAIAAPLLNCEHKTRALQSICLGYSQISTLFCTIAILIVILWYTGRLAQAFGRLSMLEIDLISYHFAVQVINKMLPESLIIQQ
jgi:hypothetical protein